MIAEAAELREKVGIVKDLDFVKGPQNTHRLDLVAYLEETAVPAQLSREMRFCNIPLRNIRRVFLIMTFEGHHQKPVWNRYRPGHHGGTWHRQ